MTSLVLTVPLTLISIFGLIVNIYILTVVLLTKQAASANNLLLLHLGAVDTLLGVLFLSFSVPGLAKGGWLSGGIPCVIHGFLFTLLHPLVLWTVCGLNCDRYYAIAAPLHYGHLVSPKKVLAGLGAGWLVSVALCLPPLFTIAPYTYSPGLGACVPDFAGYGSLWYSALYTALTLLLPATLIICCNMKILMIARYHRHRIASAIYEVTLSAQVTITHQRNPFFVPTVTAPSAGGPKFRGRNAISTVLQLLISFLLLYLPYYSVILWEASASTLLKPTIPKIHPHIFTLASTLLTCSPPINGFLYGVKSKTLRKTFQNYWRKKISKSEVNQEIQARTPSTCGSRRPSLTPLGFFCKPTIQRRLSEAILDVHKAVSSPTRPKMKRIASELTWRPHNSITGLDMSPNDDQKHQIPQVSSCNTLQVPNQEEYSIIVDEDLRNKENFYKLTRPKSSANIFLHRIFGLDHTEHSNKKEEAIKTVLESTPKRSPRILITRAFSEESEKSHSIPGTPSKDISKKYSSSATTLLERKWRQLRYNRDDDSDSDSNVRNKFTTTTKPLLDNNSSTSYRSSDSSEASELSTGRLFFTLDKDIDLNATEDQLLLSWPNHKEQDENNIRKQRNFSKETLLDTQSQEIIL